MSRLWTVGHSTHPFEVFAGLLIEHGIETLADVRTVPRSLRHPQFRDDALGRSLAERGIRYRHIAELGGWRRTGPGSPNGGWRNASFRGYADYALTEPFGAALEELLGHAALARTAIMCAEALWWRCHRRLIADRVAAAGWTVCHIAADGRAAEHRLPAFAVLDDDLRLRYPAPP